MRSTLRRLLALAAVLSVALVPLAGATAAQEDDVPHVLVFSATYGFRHPSILTGNLTLAELAAARGAFTVEFSENPADIRADKLADVDLVLFNSTTGRTPLLPQQREDFERWLSCGGGYVGVHASADMNYAWPAYAELVGAQFQAHPHNATDGDVRLVVEDDEHPANADWRGEGSFDHSDEYYRWRRDPRGTQDVNVLLSIDESTVRPGIQEGAVPYVERQPAAWTKTFRGGGRVFYTNLGHNDATWADARFRSSLVEGIGWVAGVRAEPSCLDGATEPVDAPVSFRTPDEQGGEPGEACTPPPGATTLTEAGERSAHAAQRVPVYLGVGRVDRVLDLSASGTRTADVEVTLTWPNRADDHDLVVTSPQGFAGSDALQPVAEPVETVRITGARHCDLLQIDLYNHLAVTGGQLTLDIAVEPSR
jgi:type 1 glutamine amidotransferase